MFPVVMQTGLMDGGDNGQANALMRKVRTILIMLAEDSSRTAALLAMLDNRPKVNDVDMSNALKYECHAFFEREGLEERFAMLMELEDSSDDSEGDGDKDEDKDEDKDDDEEESEVTSEFSHDGNTDESEEDMAIDVTSDEYLAYKAEMRASDIATELQRRGETLDTFQTRYKSIIDGWSAWDPDDPLKAMLKSCLDRANRSCL